MWAKGGASHEKFHAAPSKKQASLLEGALPLRNKGNGAFLEPPLCFLKKVLRGIFRGFPPFAPLLRSALASLELIWGRCPR